MKRKECRIFFFLKDGLEDFDGDETQKSAPFDGRLRIMYNLFAK